MSRTGAGLEGAGLEGSVSVRLRTAGGRVRAVSVRVRRPVVARALCGRTPDEAMRLVPLLFSLCGTAQSLAALEALEDALGLDARPHTAARALLAEAEAATNHAWQVLMDWPARLGEAPQPRELAGLRSAAAAIHPALYPARDGLRLGGGSLRPDRATLTAAIAALREGVERTVFAGPAPTDKAELERWADAGATPAARLMRRLLTPGIAGFGACGVPALEPYPAGWFGERLSADAAFSENPRQNGAPAHTGPLARRTAHPLVAALLARHGSGLAAHAAARLVELAGVAERLASWADRLDDAEPAPDTGATRRGAGSGVMETARGRLAHWLRLEDSRIADYRIAAPTEWNFAADGPLAQGLDGTATDAALAERTGLLVAALDPCVASTITIQDED
ncbi:hydrogenase (plasmid) [Azospirillum baldaniorum]|uniref:nickel-dependent hydrogenase large subunit n=2 Tax=Azospirillum baldaniorum TaxID=1064539 RepID=UPI000D5FFA05|nr:nickel-dependent hydrogenase large subunit [Azospirillum baldaniorum]AWJ92382.1 hydrogenase [Azospirillum baldaniorum]TWA75843.1 nickel-dependent hydrogenase [Azospirillum brasilense]